jgi:PAS domain S-box-containing protein
MSLPHPTPTGREISFADDEIIVSKTDLRGVITYANDVFERVSGYTEAELLGQPHNVIRHPGMPRTVFRLLWDTLQREREIFAYVLNLNKHGDAYWVFAHVTPSYDPAHQLIGYHSNRRTPYPDALPKVKQLYATLLAEEKRHAQPRAGIEAGLALVHKQLAAAGLDYDEFVFSLSRHTCLDAVST